MKMRSCNKCGTFYSLEFLSENSDCREYSCSGHVEDVGMDLPKFEQYGQWVVTTEGDCEGRSTKDLGVYEGKVSDIAIYLKDRAYYKLTFKKFIGIKHVGHQDEDDAGVKISVHEIDYNKDFKIYDGYLHRAVYKEYFGTGRANNSRLFIWRHCEL